LFANLGLVELIGTWKREDVLFDLICMDCYEKVKHMSVEDLFGLKD
jgi:hypothetical protein